VIPEHQISLTAGVMQAFNSLLSHFHLEFTVPAIAIALATAARPAPKARRESEVVGEPAQP
jgi:hypothetical protein